MTNEFIRENTRFETWPQMMDAGGVESADDITGEAFSEYIASTTGL
jgi:hypothetical protein